MNNKMLTLTTYLAEQIEDLKEQDAFYQNMLENAAKSRSETAVKLRNIERLHREALRQEDDGK